MRIAVTGRTGQVACALAERAADRDDVEIVTVGRPEMDLSDPRSVADAMAAVRPDAIISAAAYTAVDKAESEESLALAINATGAGAVAQAAARLGVPVLHLSTDYVFDGRKTTPYVEDDPVNPLGAYGRTKLAGERAVAAATPDHAIFRTAWVYSPYGGNFVKTMLRLGGERDGLRVVADQLGNPTSALDIADALITAANAMRDAPGDSGLRGIFHLSGEGETHWADFARTIFANSVRLGGPFATVEDIATADYPTPAARPANSRLDKTKVRVRFGIILPDWRVSTAQVVARLLG